MVQRYRVRVDLEMPDSVAEIARIELEADTVGWFVRFGVERGSDETGLYSRAFGHADVDGKNILGVISYALTLLSDNPNTVGAPSGSSPSDIARAKEKSTDRLGISSRTD